MGSTSLSGDLSLILTRQIIEFGKLIYGLVQYPYTTCRSIALRKPFIHLGFIALLISVYLLLSTLAKESLSTNPYFLTKSLVKAGLVISMSFFLVTFFMFGLSKIFNKNTNYLTFALLWAFSLLPTLSWFLITTVFYVLVPPPRTLSLQGQIFSGIFLVFSFLCFFWKGLLYYLSLRVGLLLNAKQIILLSLIVLPVIFGYSYLLYKLQIFKVPFI